MIRLVPYHLEELGKMVQLCTMLKSDPRRFNRLVKVKINSKKWLREHGFADIPIKTKDSQHYAGIQFECGDSNMFSALFVFREDGCDAQRLGLGLWDGRLMSPYAAALREAAYHVGGFVFPLLTRHEIVDECTF